MKIREILFCSLVILFSNQLWSDDIQVQDQDQILIQTISAKIQSKIYGAKGLNKMIVKLEVLKNSKLQCIQYRTNSIDNIDKIFQLKSKDTNSLNYQTLFNDLKNKKQTLIERKLDCEITLLRVDSLINELQKEIQNLNLNIWVQRSIWTILLDPNVFSQGIRFLPFTEQWNLNELTHVEHYSLLFTTLAGMILGYGLRVLCIKYIHQSKKIPILYRFLYLTKNFILYFTPLCAFSIFISYKTEGLKTTYTILWFVKLIIVYSLLKYLVELYLFCVINIKNKLWKLEIRKLFLIILGVLLASSIINWFFKKFLILTVTSAFFIKIYIFTSSIFLFFMWCYLIQCIPQMQLVTQELKMIITRIRHYLYFIVGLFYITRTTIAWVYGLDEISLGLTTSVLMVAMVVLLAKILFIYLGYIEESIQNGTFFIKNIRLHKLLGINPKLKVREITVFKHLFIMLTTLCFFIPILINRVELPEQFSSAYLSFINNTIQIGAFAFSLIHLIEAGMSYCAITILGKILITKYYRESISFNDVHKKSILLMALTFFNQFIAIFFSLGIAGVNLEKLSLVLGGLSIGIGIGLNTYISNMICGLIILIKNPIRIDDYIMMMIPKISVPIEGRVQSIDLLYTQILTNEENLIYLSNTSVINSAITNYTIMNKSSSCFISLKFNSDIVLVKAKELCTNILLNSNNIIHNGILAPNINDNILYHKDQAPENILDISFTVKEISEKKGVIRKIYRSIKKTLKQNNIQIIKKQEHEIINYKDDILDD